MYNIKLTKPQAQFFSSEEPNVELVGPRGSGRTTGLIAACLKYAALSDYRALFVSPAHPEVFQRLIWSFVDQNAEISYSKSRLLWEFPNGAQIQLAPGAEIPAVMYGGLYNFIGIDDLEHYHINHVETILQRLNDEDTDIMQPRVRFTAQEQWLYTKALPGRRTIWTEK